MSKQQRALSNLPRDDNSEQTADRRTVIGDRVVNDPLSVMAKHLADRACLPSDDSEIIIVDPLTGGQKGMKSPQLGAIEPTALHELARVAGYGTLKHARYNYLKGFAWSLSYDAAHRHLNAFWRGEDIVTDDPGAVPYKLYHLACAGWHCLCLLAFSLLKRGTDDRPCTVMKQFDKDLHHE